MNENKTGGAAFPLESDYGSQSGMTLRDYFAGQVIVGTLACVDAEHEAKTAYQIADAMIAERAKQGESK